MLIPISKIRDTSCNVSYNLYDLDARTVTNFKVREINKALKDGIDIRGFNGHLGLTSYFRNIGVIGENLDNTQHYTVVKKKIYKTKTIFLVVDAVGNDFELEKVELINLIKDGVIVSGVRLSNNMLKVSSQIKIEITK